MPTTRHTVCLRLSSRKCHSLSAFAKRISSTPSVSPTQISPLTAHLPRLLENCKSMDQLEQMHGQTIKQGFTGDPVIESKIIALCFCFESGGLDYAQKTFDKIPEPNVREWNAMIKGYSRMARPKDAYAMYLDMLQRDVMPDERTFPFLFKGFTHDIASECVKELHAQIVKFKLGSNVFVQNSLIHMYCLGGQVEVARGIFNMSTRKNVITWNSMIAGYNRNKQFSESRRLFGEMEKQNISPSSVTLVSVLSACSKLKDLNGGRWVHHRYLKSCKVDSNLTLENALVDMYAVCGEMDMALEIFENMEARNVISWTGIVSGFANLGEIDRARSFFDQMPERDCVSWTAMIDGYLRVNRFKEALTLFQEMQVLKINPDKFTMVSLLIACANLGALELGEWIRTYIEKNTIRIDAFVGTALMDMYFKCGSVEKAMNLFGEMPCRDKFTWTVVIVGLAMNGQGKQALNTFNKMLRASIRPDEITYIGVLCACTHTGNVEEGRKFFAAMTAKHGINPNVAHYGCMVDLLGRAGNLLEAYEVIAKMRVKPNSAVWGALLGACRVHKNVEMAEMAAKEVLELEPENKAVYVLLCNIYASCRRWEDMWGVRKLMMERGIKKTPGCSLIEINGSIHEFVSGDQSHPQSKEIYSEMEKISDDLKVSGYIPDTSEVFLDMGVEEKECALTEQRFPGI